MRGSFYRVERREERWRLSGFEGVYVRDELVPCVPGQTISIAPGELAQFRASYRLLSYVLSRNGYQVNSDVPGEGSAGNSQPPSSLSYLAGRVSRGRIEGGSGGVAGQWRRGMAWDSGDRSLLWFRGCSYSVRVGSTAATSRTSRGEIPNLLLPHRREISAPSRRLHARPDLRSRLLYESTGQYGRSFVRKVRLQTGAVVQQLDLPASVFGEGLTERGNQLLVLTWTSGKGYVLDRAGLAVTGTFAYAGEGSGLTRSPDAIFVGDGSSRIRLLDPESLQERSRIKGTDQGAPVARPE